MNTNIHRCAIGGTANENRSASIPKTLPLYSSEIPSCSLSALPRQSQECLSRTNNRQVPCARVNFFSSVILVAMQLTHQLLFDITRVCGPINQEAKNWSAGQRRQKYLTLALSNEMGEQLCTIWSLVGRPNVNTPSLC